MVTVHREFMDAFGQDAIRAIGAIVAWGHVQALAFGEENFGEVGRDRCGILRWLRIDADLLEFQGRFPGVTVGLVNHDSGGQRHIEIIAGKFRILVVHDRDPDALVPISEYGKTLAKVNQGLLFEEKPEGAAASHYSAILFHSKAITKGKVPERLEIRFPDGASGYAVEHLRLYTEFPELHHPESLGQVISELRRAGVAEEVVLNQAVPVLRAAQKTGS